MRLVDRIRLPDPRVERVIELYVGDIATMKRRQRVDILGVSAFPDDYAPTSSSVIGALYEHGISVETLSYDKAEDLRADFGCWLSHRVDAPGFDRILCFEPRLRGRPDEVMGDFFRCVAALAGGTRSFDSLAIPIFAAGDQRHPTSIMLNAILQAAKVWMKAEHPLQRLRIVATERRSKTATEVFRAARKALQPGDARATTPDETATPDVDIVLTAAPEDCRLADVSSTVISTVAPELRLHRSPLPQDTQLRDARQHYERLERCRRVIALITPHFTASRACLDDLFIAHYRSYHSSAPLLFPILLKDTPLPPSMRILRMVHCCDMDEKSLRLVSAVLAIQLQGLRETSAQASDPDAALSTTHALAISSLAEVLGAPVLGSSRMHSDAGTPGTVSRESVVLDLCRSLFSVDEFRIELRRISYGVELLDHLPPAASAPPITFFDAAVEAMSRRGLINYSFFQWIRELRPFRELEIRQVAAEWGCVLPPPRMAAST